MKDELLSMQAKLEVFADRIKEIDRAGPHEQLYNELWDTLDNAGAIIDSILL